MVRLLIINLVFLNDIYLNDVYHVLYFFNNIDNIVANKLFVLCDPSLENNFVLVGY